MSSSMSRDPSSTSSPRNNTPTPANTNPAPPAMASAGSSEAHSGTNYANDNEEETTAAAENNDDDPDGDDNDDNGDDKAMALPLAASVILTSLPRDASAALATAGDLGIEKVTIRLKPVGSAPMLRQQVFKIGAKQRFSAITASLRRRLASEIKPGEGVFCYVNSVFAPNPDEIVGGLWRCFKTGDELVVAYAKTPAFG